MPESQTTAPPCECTAPGWCARHQTYKSAGGIDFCRKNDAIRAEWDARAKVPIVRRPIVVEPGAPPPRKGCGSCGKKTVREKITDLWSLGWDFAAAMKHWAGKGFRFATREQYEHRKSLCEACPFELLKNGRCGEGGDGDPKQVGCGCFVNLKAAILVEKTGKSDCINGVWPAIEQREEPRPTRARLPKRDVAPTARMRSHQAGHIDTPAIGFTCEPLRHLLFHCYPIKGTEGEGTGVWQRHAEQLRRRLHLFKGRRVVAIATDSKTDSAEDVQQVYADIADKFIVTSNDRSLREVATFEALWNEIPLSDPNSITFYAHTKGITKPVNPGVSVHRWADVMYEVLLDYPELIEETLERYHCAGTFRRLGRMFGSAAGDWHYSGSFYWMRNHQLAQRQWRRINRTWWGIEAWPAVQFSRTQAACLFYCDSRMNLYHMREIQKAEKDLEQWKQDRIASSTALLTPS